ncbi:alkyl hydroperoxide reductase : Antioxidant, AhpC/Tsa family OS=Synechococcus sp. (strain JA-2-3B'a(2-13)) GN=CYB_1057 PE=4 SV=1: AhpC-TSA [Gemmataceae bacterium]|nr:alkyl hydroperoxide reductase : Antioxidant, AhpC/Tsa family OS=Synechococcus sp. (strain JA-2-3B'a(2-13)) GN=CYB_1057 PE=4 SV=1: AhpC-TSA [Gemmataceae bacterium]VTT97321.1 alkyl hydroperoxide reductase : Antioxidant, AhpC/Tsa family OS=Synechococcus sp. (strain JA-2-3B'a(2-13)) GN=CYB_1057 PE=4 SV=1: AhpC-TSA [Gemmataceae bacterium]
MLRFAARAVAVATAVALAASSSPADDTMLKVKAGDKFPVVALEAAQIEKLGLKDAKTVSIADLKGKTVVIFFYPKALTKGCTVESCGFRDALASADFPKDVVILGASADDVPLQKQFIEKEKLTYPLLADKEMKLTKELGIVSPKNAKVTQRVTFVVDKEGKIAKIYDTVNPATHPKEVVEFLKGQK